MIEICGDETLNESIAITLMGYSQDMVHNEHVPILNYSGDRNNVQEILKVMQGQSDRIQNRFRAILQDVIKRYNVQEIDHILVIMTPYEICQAALLSVDVQSN